MFNFTKRFREDESGAVTVDWVALTGGLMIMAVATVYAIRDGTDQMGSRISTEIDKQLP